MKYVYVEHWFTISVVTLPAGWHNIYRVEVDGTEFSDPCPALLLQELRETNHEGEKRNLVKHDPPLETRVVFSASTGDGMIEPAHETGNYLRTEFGDGSSS